MKNAYRQSNHENGTHFFGITIYDFKIRLQLQIFVPQKSHYIFQAKLKICVHLKVKLTEKGSKYQKLLNKIHV